MNRFFSQFVLALCLLITTPFSSAQTIEEQLARAKRIVAGLPVHLQALDIDVYLPEEDGWATMTLGKGADQFHTITRRAAQRGEYSLKFEQAMSFRNCLIWHQRKDEWKKAHPESEGKFVAGIPWLVEGWHAQAFEIRLIAQICREIVGGILVVTVFKPYAEFADGDAKAISNVLTAINDKVAEIDERTVATPVRLPVLKVSFTSPTGSYWMAMAVRMGPDGKADENAAPRDFISREWPATPALFISLTWVPQAADNCAHAVDSRNVPGGYATPARKIITDGAKYVPASWSQQVIWRVDGIVTGCADLPGRMLAANILSERFATDADFSMARAVLESITLGITKPVPPAWSVGTRVQCDWKGGGIYYPGVIARKDGERLSIDYDDGDKEKTTVDRCRIP